MLEMQGILKKKQMGLVHISCPKYRGVGTIIKKLNKSVEEDPTHSPPQKIYLQR